MEFHRLTESSSDSAVDQFIKDKYVSRLYVPKGAIDPVEEFRTGQTVSPVPVHAPAVRPAPRQAPIPVFRPPPPPVAQRQQRHVASPGVVNQVRTVPSPARREQKPAPPAVVPNAESVRPAATINKADLFDFDFSSPEPIPPPAIRISPSSRPKPKPANPFPVLQPAFHPDAPQFQQTQYEEEESKAKPAVIPTYQPQAPAQMLQAPPPAGPFAQYYGSCPPFQYPTAMYGSVPAYVYPPPQQFYAPQPPMGRACSDMGPNVETYFSAGAASGTRQNIPRDKLDRMVRSGDVQRKGSFNVAATQFAGTGYEAQQTTGAPIGGRKF